MFNTLVSSKVRRAILKKLLSEPESQYYVRQLAGILLISVGSVHKELAKLEKEGIIKSEYVGTVRFVSANKNYRLYKEIERIIFEK